MTYNVFSGTLNLNQSINNALSFPFRRKALPYVSGERHVCDIMSPGNTSRGSCIGVRFVLAKILQLKRIRPHLTSDRADSEDARAERRLG